MHIFININTKQLKLFSTDGAGEMLDALCFRHPPPHDIVRTQLKLSQLVNRLRSVNLFGFSSIERLVST